ncbi:hypothetical protein Agub_g2752 [Astrephomene gubernaculifera]|uniref:Uncharacterized protein n=1 Tax=Astrephomene gubernaculifera TaxID=47775 RepID=A0AAD3DHK5_9CHLO|nr:hypothetical protein Agub_g2752 [Astrephomene gubernaculifera]
MQRFHSMLRVAPFIVSDMWRLRCDEVWVSVALLALLLARIVPSFLLTANFYGQAVTDAVAFVDQCVSQAANATRLIAPWLLNPRLLVTATAVYLALAHATRRFRRKGLPGTTATAPTTANITAASHVSLAEAAAGAQRREVPNASSPHPLVDIGATSHASFPKPCCQAGHEGASNMAATAAVRYQRATVAPLQPMGSNWHPTGSAVAHSSAAAAGAALPPPLPPRSAHPNTAGALSAADLAACRTALQREPYRSPVGRCAVRFKIPWAEPEQLTPGYEARIAAVAAQYGLRVAGSYVRAGCIELVLVLEAAAAGGRQGLGEQPAGGSPHRSTTTATREQVGWLADVAALDVTAVVGALQLRHAGGGGGRSSPLDAMRLSQVSTSLRLLNPAAAPPQQNPTSTPTTPTPTLSVTACPRVLLLPPAGSPPPPAAAHPTSPPPALPPIAAGSNLVTGADSHTAPALATVLLRIRRERCPTSITFATSTSTSASSPCTSSSSRSDGGEVEVLVRAHSAYLPARLRVLPTGGGGAGGAREARAAAAVAEGQKGEGQEAAEGQTDLDDDVEEVYALELLALPERPGTVMLDITWREVQAGQEQQQQDLLPPAVRASEVRRECRATATTLPLLALPGDMEDMAAELEGAAAAWPPDSCDELNALLYDMGTWAATSMQHQQPQQHRRDGSPCLEFWSVLGPHLLKHAEAAGWEATASRIRSDLTRLRAVAAEQQQQQQVPPQQLSRARTTSSFASFVGGCLSSGMLSMLGSAYHAACGDAAVRQNHSGVSSAQRRPMGRAVWLSALLRVLGWEVAPPAEAAAFEAFLGAWSVAQGHTIQMVECLALLCLLFRTSREGHPPLGAANAVAVVGCGVGTLATLAWLVLPYRVWVRLVGAAKLPRYGGHLAAKALVALAGLPAPPGIAAYGSGVGALLLEGCILPGACLMSPRAAALISALKLPLNAAMLVATGAAAGPGAAVLLAARVEALALLTTLACHLYMRLGYQWRAEQLAAGAGAAGGGQAGGRLECGGAEGGGGVAGGRGWMCGEEVKSVKVD